MSWEENQYNEWGFIVRNTRISAPHIAEGLIKTLAALDDTISAPRTVTSSGALEHLKAGISTTYGTTSYTLSDEARATCITKTGFGTFSISADATTATPSGDSSTMSAKNKKSKAAIKKLERSGQAHFAERLDGELTRTHHVALSEVLNADARVNYTGASTPTTPGVALTGFDSNYTLGLLHAQTFLGLLSLQGADGLQVLSELRDVACSFDDPHSQLIKLLNLGNEPTNQGSLGWLPLPDGEHWDAEAIRLTEQVRRLLSWSKKDSGGASKLSLLMQVVDLVGLTSICRLFRWTAEAEADASPVLIAPNIVMNSDARSAQEAARYALRMIIGRVRRMVDTETDHFRKSEKNNHDPGAAALALGAACGWLWPLNASGGARRYFSPGTRQLNTLVRVLIKPGEELRWGEFHSRALEEFNICLGGYNAQMLTKNFNQDNELGFITASHLMKAGALCQQRLLMLGLARRESDNVVVVNGGLL